MPRAAEFPVFVTFSKFCSCHKLILSGFRCGLLRDCGLPLCFDVQISVSAHNNGGILFHIIPVRTSIFTDRSCGKFPL